MQILNKSTSATSLTRETFPSNKQAGARDMIIQAGWINIAIISPLKRSVALHQNKFESPSTQGCFVPSLAKMLAQWSGGGDFLCHQCTVYLLFCYHLPLKKGIDLHLNKFESLSFNNGPWPSFEYHSIMLRDKFISNVQLV